MAHTPAHRKIDLFNFLKEYEELCIKHNLFISSAGEVGLIPFEGFPGQYREMMSQLLRMKCDD